MINFEITSAVEVKGFNIVSGSFTEGTYTIINEKYAFSGGRKEVFNMLTRDSSKDYYIKNIHGYSIALWKIHMNLVFKITKLANLYWRL